MASPVAPPSQNTTQAEPSRRVIEEIETLNVCTGDGGEADCLPSQRHQDCQRCHGTGLVWQVTSRRVQIGVPFEEQAAHAYIKGMHAHVRKAAQSMRDAGADFEKLGHKAQAVRCIQAAKAILEPIEGQD